MEMLPKLSPAQSLLLRNAARRADGRVIPRDSLRGGARSKMLTALLRLTLLEPAIIQTILAGQQPRCMSLLWFQRHPLPTDWVAQREVVAGFDA